MAKYIASVFVTLTLSLSSWNLVSGSYSKDFMTSSCGALLTSRSSGRLETSSSLTYANNIDCYVTIAVQENRRIRLVFKRFELEGPVGGTCRDLLTIYDGPSSSYPELLTAKCGSVDEAFVLNSTSNRVALRFSSDADAVYRGFELEYTAFSEGPCATTDFQCDVGICVDADSTCDNFNQCGDYSDESQCSDSQLAASESSGVDIPLIVGAVLGSVAFVIILIVTAVKVHQYLKWRKYKQENSAWTLDELYEYPVTDKYNRFDVGEKGRLNPRNVTFYSNAISPQSSSILECTEEVHAASLYT